MLSLATKDTVLDDSILLQDRLLRSLHRNREGHLASSRETHKTAIETEHNIATLYIYTADNDSYMLHEHYVFSAEPLSYKDWLKIVIRECFRIEEDKSETYYGVYGWLTSHLKITPMRTGDLFIKIDSEGATGVRLSFDTKEAKRNAHNKTHKKTRR
jgi:hypothetical protein